MLLIRIKGIFSFVLFFIMTYFFCQISIYASHDFSSLHNPLKSLIIVESYTDSVCQDQETGFILISIPNTIEEYDILWSNGQTELFLNNLQAGLYSVTLSDGINHLDSLDITINNYPHTEFELINDPTACGSLTSIELIALDNNVGVQNIIWSVPGDQLFLDNIDHGHYTVNITDMYGCNQFMEFNTSYIDTVPPEITLKNLQYELGADGKAPIIMPKDYVLNIFDNCNGKVDIFPEQIILDCSNVGLNKIKVNAIDDDGNITIDSFYIEILDIDFPRIFCVQTMTIPSCDTVFYSDPFTFDNCGIKSIEITEGLPNGSVYPEGINILIFAATDNSGNTSYCETKVIVDYGIDYQISSFETSCFNSNDGLLYIQAEGIHGPIEYQLSNYIGDLINMPVGSYHIQFTDTLGCTVYDTAFITSPDPIELFELSSIPFEEFTGSNGWIDIQLTGGVAPFYYSWYKNGYLVSQSQNPEGLSEGKYIFKSKRFISM